MSMTMIQAAAPSLEQLQPYTREIAIAILLAVLLAGGLLTGTLTATDSSEYITAEKAGPVVQASVDDCSDDTCRVSIEVTEWNAIHIAAVRNERTGEVRYLGPDQPTTTFESVEREQHTAGEDSPSYPNEVTVFLPVKDREQPGYESDMTIFLDRPDTYEQQLRIIDVYDPADGDVTFDGEVDKEPSEKPDI